MARSLPSRPGLAKTRGLPLFTERTTRLWQSRDYLWRELFGVADIMSEGAVRSESEGPVYYGTTSIFLSGKLLRSQSRPLSHDDGRSLDMLALTALDPHARVRAIRLARLEAELRAGAPLGRVRAELLVAEARGGLELRVEIEARLKSVPALTPLAAGNKPSRVPSRR